MSHNTVKIGTSSPNATGSISPSLSDLSLGSAASSDTTDFLQVSNNLSDVTAATARGNLGLGSAAESATTDFLSATGPIALGGNLDVGSSDITSSSNANIEFAPHGNGKVTIKGNTGGSGQIVLNCEDNSHGVTLKGPPHSASATYTLTLPNALGSADDVLKTDASGNLSWTAQSSGGGGGSAPVVSEQNSAATLSAPASSGILEQIYTISSSSAVTLTLPSATSTNMGEGFKYQFKRLGTGAVTIQCATNEFIDHSAQTNFSIGAQYDSITLVANGTSPNASWLLI
tara:strand:+ start:28466 stop:29326 length:861 start_codon:yes stop_codon:yes gene_type:complete